MKIAAAIASVIAIVVLLFLVHFAVLDSRICQKPERYRVANLRGRVVGMSFTLLQYRWFRRLFTPDVNSLRLVTSWYEDRPGVGLIPQGRFIRTVAVDSSGNFDFGPLSPAKPPEQYSLETSFDGYNSGFGVTIDPAVKNNYVLLDISPAYYCSCCGMDLELH